MTDDEILKGLINSAWEDLRFYSNRGKAEREKWVVGEFLKISGIPFDVDEIASLEQDSKIDVVFQDANYQVKEIVNPGLKRSRYYKELYNALKRANDLESIELPSIAEDVPEIESMYSLVLSESIKLGISEKYKKEKSGLDLIFYVSRSRASLIRESEVNSNDFNVAGWRSVSCINSKQAAVLFSGEESPEYMRGIAGTVVENHG